MSAELPDSRGICVVGEPNNVIEKWWPNFYMISQGARPATRASMTQHAQCGAANSWEGNSCTKTGHIFYCPQVTLKRKTDDLIFAWSPSCTTGRAPLAVHSAGQPVDERATAVSETGHNTLLLSPPPLPPIHPLPSRLETVRLGAKKADQLT